MFFGNDRLMDFELMGGDGRKTIISEMQRRGKQAFLPPAVPFGSKQRPALVTLDPAQPRSTTSSKERGVTPVPRDFRHRAARGRISRPALRRLYHWPPH